MKGKKVTLLRQDFPFLQKKKGEKKPVYFDNACQSLRPEPVIQAINEYYRDYPGCAGRSAHRIGEEVSRAVAAARKKIARFLRVQHEEEIIFTRNTTEGINLVAQSWPWQEGDRVLISDKEHNSNLLPWLRLQKQKIIQLDVVPSTEDNQLDLNRWEEVLRQKKVRLISVGFTSNLDGVTIPAAELIKLAHDYGALVLLDGAQTVPHQQLNLAKLGVDFLAFSGHKMLGPSGTGVLYARRELLEQMNPFLLGGETVARSTYQDYTLLPPPEKFEAGLQNYAGIIGLGAAVEYLEKVGFDFIQKQEEELNSFLTAQLQQIPQLQIIGPADPRQRGGIISFYLPQISASQLALILDSSHWIMVRAGQHCVHSWFAARKIPATLRISLYFYNTREEAEIFLQALQQTLKIL